MASAFAPVSVQLADPPPKPRPSLTDRANKKKNPKRGDFDGRSRPVGPRPRTTRVVEDARGVRLPELRGDVAKWEGRALQKAPQRESALAGSSPAVASNEFNMNNDLDALRVTIIDDFIATLDERQRKMFADILQLESTREMNSSTLMISASTVIDALQAHAQDLRERLRAAGLEVPPVPDQLKDDLI